MEGRFEGMIYYVTLYKKTPAGKKSITKTMTRIKRQKMYKISKHINNTFKAWFVFC
jgi:uncharacterized protein with GYD domain